MYEMKIPSFPDMVLSGMGYNPDDYEFIEYEYDYSEGKVDWHGKAVPCLSGLVWKHIITQEYIRAKPTDIGFQIFDTKDREDK